MDTSKENVLMCEKAEKIQQGRYPIDGDFYILRNLEGAPDIIEVHGCVLYRDQQTPYKFIWLPRQDQLQEMVIDNTKGCDKWTWLLEFFFRWTNKSGFQNWSMEQLWLAFVMSEKYNKKWTGKEWRLNNVQKV